MNYFIRYIVIPNFIFGIFSTFATSSRALINIDYCLIGLCSPFIGRYWAALMYVVFFILDLLVAVAPTYHLKPVILLNIFRELSAFAPSYIALILVLIVVPLLGMWYFTFKREVASPQKTDLRARSVLLIAPICFIMLDIVNGSSNAVRLSDATHVNYNVAGSALVKLVRDIRLSVVKQHKELKVLGPDEYAMSRVHSELSAGSLPLQNIVLVIVESWGVSSDSSLNQALAAPLTDPKLSSRYQMRQATVPFYGATVSAELRELYARRGSDPEDLVSATSLPALLAAKGYESIALHGFMPQFFGRNEWYPLAGFSSFLFINDIDKLQPGQERCGSANFRGICDDRVPSLIRQMLMTPAPVKSPKFIYWLTLNSHYPFAAPDHPSRFACEAFPLTSQNKDLCHHSATLNLTFEALGKLIADPAIPPTRFIFVGDHSPPFLMRSKDALYDKKVVPMIELIPKERDSKQ